MAELQGVRTIDGATATHLTLTIRSIKAQATTVPFRMVRTVTGHRGPHWPKFGRLSQVTGDVVGFVHRALM